jgi:hypothetical protein
MSKGSEIACFESRLRFLPLNVDFLGFFCLPLEKKWEAQTGRWFPYVRPLSEYRGTEAVSFRRSLRVDAIESFSRLRSLFVSLPCEIVRTIAVREAEIIEFIPLLLLHAIWITVLSSPFYHSSLHPDASTLPDFLCDFFRLQTNSFFYMAVSRFTEIRRDTSKWSISSRIRKNQWKVSVSRYIGRPKRRDGRESTVSNFFRDDESR